MSSEHYPVSPADLRQAWYRKEFRLHYQPIVDLRTGFMVGAEALLRWQHPLHGLLPPAQFISLAESSGLIVQIGEWVLREACAQDRAWHEQAQSPPIKMAVNVSAIQMTPGFADVVRSALKDARLAPGHLEIELTESVAFGTPGIFGMLEALCQTRVEFAADDFGTGYSCLLHLKCCPITKLKIDKSFVDRLQADTRDRAIVQAVILLGHGLGMRIVAEGVETEVNLELLREAGCDEAQGYLIARPMLAEEFAQFLRRYGPSRLETQVGTRRP